MTKIIKNILITGGAGYIGSMLATRLVALGHNVTIIDSLKFSSSSLNHLFRFKNFKLIFGDVRNKKLIKKELKKN
jgi:UDP-glucose 4-epimerase